MDGNILRVAKEGFIEGNVIKFPFTMDDDTYASIALLLESIGGKWVDKVKGFLYKHNPEQSFKNLINQTKIEIEVSDEMRWQEQTQFYPTPTTISAKLLEMANIKSGDVILEPSAGRGGIADLFPTENGKILIEYDVTNYEYLLSRGYNVMNGDFLSFTELIFDKVIMNPPFSKQQDIRHILHAFGMLNVGGTLVAVANENILYRHNKEAVAFQNFLKENNAEVIEIESGAFVDSGTMINTIIIKINKQ